VREGSPIARLDTTPQTSAATLNARDKRPTRAERRRFRVTVGGAGHVSGRGFLIVAGGSTCFMARSVDEVKILWPYGSPMRTTPAAKFMTLPAVARYASLRSSALAEATRPYR
jgi:hypothetical protein